MVNYSSNPKISYNIRDDVLKVEVLVKLPENLCCGKPNSNNSSDCKYENSINDNKTLDKIKVKSNIDKIKYHNLIKNYSNSNIW